MTCGANHSRVVHAPTTRPEARPAPGPDYPFLATPCLHTTMPTERAASSRAPVPPPPPSPLSPSAHQVQVVELYAIRVGRGGVHRHLHAVYHLWEFLYAVLYDFGIPAAGPGGRGARRRHPGPAVPCVHMRTPATTGASVAESQDIEAVPRSGQGQGQGAAWLPAAAKHHAPWPWCWSATQRTRPTVVHKRRPHPCSTVDAATHLTLSHR